MQKGRITLPADDMPIEELKAIIDKWGADAIRDSDGTTLPAEASQLGSKIYGKYFITRGDNEWAKMNPDDIQHTFLLSEYTLATNTTLKIDPMKTFFKRTHHCGSGGIYGRRGCSLRGTRRWRPYPLSGSGCTSGWFSELPGHSPG